MMKKCLDEGILQAYLDGELSGEMTREAATHIAQCELCAASLAEAENESVFFASAFAPDASLSVPTEQLRARINAAVAHLESSPDAAGREKKSWNPGSFFATLSGFFALTPRHSTAFASLLAVVAFALVFMVAQRRSQQPVVNVNAGDELRIAQGGSPVVENPARAGDAPVAVAPAATDARKIEVAGLQVSKPAGIGYVNAGFTRSPATRATRSAGEKVAKRVERDEPAQFLPGEKAYQDAIASLSRTIQAGGEVVLKPSVRADYERNLAVLDKAISETRGAAMRNPKDGDAVNFLMSAYQSKVELLTTVADQAQVATLGR